MKYNIKKIPLDRLCIISIILLSFGFNHATPFYPANTDTSINTDDFRALLLNHDIFVDKTFLLDEFIKLEGSRLVPLIIRPKGWGKSINMDMIRRFFEIEVDNSGERLLKDQSINDKLFMGGELALNSTTTKKLKKLKVSLFVARHLGQFPVILLKLKNTTGVNYEEIETKIKNRVMDMFKDHEYLLNSTRITDKEKLSNYVKGEFDANDLKSSVLFLSQKLYEHFGRKLHILIDDYDQPIINAYMAFGNKTEEFDKLLKLLIDVYTSAMKDNPNRDVGLITGVLQISLTPTMTTGLNNLDICTLTRTKFSKSFGLREPEVQEVLKQRPEIKLDLKDIKNWYNGYHYNEQIYYNAWSTIRCLAQNGTLGYHGFDLDNRNALVDRILSSDEMQEKVHHFVSGKSVNFPNLHARTESVNWEKIDQLQVLFLNGYLSPETASDLNSNIAIPNKEIKQIYESKILEWVCRKVSVDDSEFRSFASLLPDAKVDQFRDTLQKYLSSGASFLSKMLYDSLVIGVKNALSLTHTDEQDEANNLILIPKPSKSDVAIILKYKTGKTEELASLATTGLQEISTSKFGSDLKTNSHVKKIIKISIAFGGEKLGLEYNID